MGKLSVMAALSSTTLFVENWPQFRGADTDGVASSHCPTSWNWTKNVCWKVALSGEGWSGPIV